MFGGVINFLFLLFLVAVDILQPVAQKFMFAPLRQVNELQQIS